MSLDSLFASKSKSKGKSKKPLGELESDNKRKTQNYSNYQSENKNSAILANLILQDEREGWESLKDDDERIFSELEKVSDDKQKVINEDTNGKDTVEKRIWNTKPESGDKLKPAVIEVKNDPQFPSIKQEINNDFPSLNFASTVESKPEKSPEKSWIQMKSRGNTNTEPAETTTRYQPKLVSTDLYRSDRSRSNFDSNPQPATSGGWSRNSATPIQPNPGRSGFYNPPKSTTTFKPNKEASTEPQAIKLSNRFDVLDGLS